MNVRNVLFMLNEAKETGLTLWCAINSLREDVHHRGYYHGNATVMNVITEALRSLTISSEIWISKYNETDASSDHAKASYTVNVVNAGNISNTRFCPYSTRYSQPFSVHDCVIYLWWENSSVIDKWR